MYNPHSLQINFEIEQDFYSQFDINLFPKLEDQKTNPILYSLFTSFTTNENIFPLCLGKNKEIIITEEKWNLFKNEYFNLKKIYKTDSGQYRRCKIDKNKVNNIIDQLPIPLRSVIHEVSLQITYFDGLWPHTDHNRSCSLFCNLTDSNFWYTSWYEAKSNSLQLESKNLGFFWPWAPSNAEKKFTTCLEQYQWYTFDNITYHGTECIHSFKPRRSLVIEFKDISISELNNLISNNY